MKQTAPTPGLAIQIVTAIYIALTVGALVAGFFQPVARLVGAILAALGLYCYWFWSPVAYELENGALTVCFRASRKRFDGVTGCSLITERLPCLTFRLCGNGGVFAGSGIFWNRQFGVFRAYVTRSKPTELVLVETARQKIIISPADPQGFVTGAATG